MKKIRRYVYSFWHDPRTWQTDGQTDTAWRHRHRFARQKRKKMMTRALGKSQKRPGICDTVGALISYCLGCDRFASLMSSRWGNLCNANELFEWHIPLPVSGARITSLCRIVRMKLWSWRYDGRQIAKYSKLIWCFYVFQTPCASSETPRLIPPDLGPIKIAMMIFLQLTVEYGT